MNRKNKIYRNLILLFVFSFFALLSCKNTSMDAMLTEYNKNFVPAKDVFWITENIEKSTMTFEKYKLKKEYKLSKNTGLFIIGGPRDCDEYIWFLDGVIKSGNQVLELPIKVQKQKAHLWDSTDSIPVGTHTLVLQCKVGKKQKKWETKLIIE